MESVQSAYVGRLELLARLHENTGNEQDLKFARLLRMEMSKANEQVGSLFAIVDK